MPAAYPISVDLSGRLVVIVGGGAVAARKAAGALAAGPAAVKVVAPAFVAEMPLEVQRIAEPYTKRHLDGAFLVFAATDLPEVNAQVVNDAHAIGALVNRADSDEESPGDFTVPALIRRGPLTVAVAAGSPALSAAIRDRIAANLGEGWLQMAQAMQDLRPMIRDASGLPIARRREVFRTLATDEAVAVLTSGGIDGLRKWIAARIAEESGATRTIQMRKDVEVTMSSLKFQHRSHGQDARDTGMFPRITGVPPVPGLSPISGTCSFPNLSYPCSSVFICGSNPFVG